LRFPLVNIPDWYREIGSPMLAALLPRSAFHETHVMNW
jgi:hypothetical protein